MEYLGCFYSQNVPNRGVYGELLDYTEDGHEMIIYYDKNAPFVSRMFAISNDVIGADKTYDLFDYVSSVNEMDDVKKTIKSIAETLILYKKNRSTI